MVIKTTSERLPGRFVTMPGGTVARYCDIRPSIAPQIPSILLLHGGNLSLESYFVLDPIASQNVRSQEAEPRDVRGEYHFNSNSRNLGRVTFGQMNSANFRLMSH
jgi:hypothetical protein